MISNTGDYGHFAGAGRGRQLLTRALRRLLRLPAHRRAAGRHAARRVSRRAPNPDAVDRSAEHRARRTSRRPPRSPAPTPPRPSGSPSRSRRADGERARTRASGARSCWWTSSGAGAPPATTPRRSWCGSTASITRGDSRSSGWRTRSPAIPRWTPARCGATAKVRHSVSAAPGGHQRHRAAGATLPQLHGFTSFPTTVFLGRDGRVRRVHAGFYGPATGAQHERMIREFEREIERLAGGARGESGRRARTARLRRPPTLP